jgi:tRNA threonylcarbamoyladenosine biosynthesis protein TsaE
LLYHSPDRRTAPRGRAGELTAGRTTLAELVSRNASETLEVGRKIGRGVKAGMIIALEGPLGAGKTTLVKGIAEALGIAEPVTSPTFTIISEYPCVIEQRPSVLYHIDLFRIGRAEELDELGLEDLLASDGLTVIEWSEKAAEFLPPDALCVSFRIQTGGERILSISGAEA